MGRGLLRAVRAEHLKLRRSLTLSAILLGGLFVPAIMLAVRLHQRTRTAAMHASGTYWRQHWLESFESVSILILPLLLILVVTLVVHLEYRNNTWKQLHASPLRLPVLYLAKLAVLLLLLLEIFFVVNAGLLVAGWLPLQWIVPGSRLARGFPAAELLGWNVRFLVDCLPIVGIQYALALRFRNVLVPLGLGVAGWIAGLIVINTAYVVAVPYAYLGVDYLVVLGHRSAASLPAHPPLLALAAFGASLLAGVSLHAAGKDRGAAP